jgi:hypothetical protein
MEFKLSGESRRAFRISLTRNAFRPKNQQTNRQQTPITAEDQPPQPLQTPPNPQNTNMNLKSILSPIGARRGLSILGLAALMTTSASADVGIIDNGAFTTDSATNLDWADIDLAWGVSFATLLTRLEPGGDLAAAGWSLATQAEVQAFWANAGVTNAGAFSTAQYGPVNDLINKIKGSMSFAVHPLSPTTWYSGSRLQGLTADGFDVYSWGPAMNVDPIGLTGYSNIWHYQPRSVPNPDWGYWLKRTHVPPPNTVLLAKDDAVPGLPGKTFTSFGVPAISDNGTVAVLGMWTGGGSGILVGGTLVAAEGDVISGTTTIDSMKDPVIDESDHVAFICTLAGPGITPANNLAVVSNAPGGTLAIVAQEGTQAPGAPIGALWKNFTSVAAPGNGAGVLILGKMNKDTGGLTSGTDDGLWAADTSGNVRLMLHEGTTVIGTKTVKNFAVLKAVAGSPGQTHAFNNTSELVSKVTFTDGVQAVVHTNLP